MTGTSFTLLAPTYGPGYAALLRALSKLCTHCSLTVRDFDRTNGKVLSFLEKVRSYEVNRASVQEWPGTRLSGDQTADLYMYKVTDDLLDIMTRDIPSLFSWITPDLPEDPCFYRMDGRVVLGTISHDMDWFLEVSDSELSYLTDAVPDLEITRSLPEP